MTAKFYLHNAATSDTGTLPATAASVSATTPTKVATGGDTNRAMDSSIGTSQASIALTTNASTTAQSALIARFLSTPLAAQTIAAQTISFRLGIAQSNTASAFTCKVVVAVWRPSTGAVVGRITDLATATAAAGTTEADSGVITATATSTAVTVQAGDILVVELWRASAAQTMATAYTNTVYYDGTTEGSATTNAAYVLFANDVSVLTPVTIQVDLVQGTTVLQTWTHTNVGSSVVEADQNVTATITDWTNLRLRFTKTQGSLAAVVTWAQLVAPAVAASNTPQSASDSGAIVSSDSASIATSAADSGPAISSDSATTSTQRTVSDSGAITSSDAAPIASQSSSSDVGPIVSSDSASVAITTPISASDSGPLVSADAASTATTSAVSDAGPVVSSDSASTATQRTVADSGPVVSSDSWSFAQAVSDNGPIVSTDSQSLATQRTVADTGPVVSSDSVVGGIPNVTVLTEDFEGASLDTTKWAVGLLSGANQPTVTVTQANGVLTISPDTTNTGYNGIHSVGYYKLTNSAVYVQVVTANSGSGNADTVLQVGDTGGWIVKFDRNGSTLNCMVIDVGGGSIIASPTYSATNHKWWRLREGTGAGGGGTAGTTYWDTSPDGITWTNIASATTPSSVDSVQVALVSGTQPVSGNPGSAVFDNVNAPPHTAVTASDSETMSGGDQLAVAATTSMVDSGPAISSDTTSLASQRSPADSTAVVSSDALIEAGQESAPDSGPIVSSDSAPISITAALADAAPIASSDAVSASSPVASSDTGPIASTDTMALASQRTVADTGPVVSTDSVSVSITVTVADTGPIVSSDSASTVQGNVPVNASESTPAVGADALTLSTTRTLAESTAVVSGDVDALATAAADSSLVIGSDFAALVTPVSLSETTPVVSSDSTASVRPVTDAGPLVSSDAGAIAATETTVDGAPVVSSDSAALLGSRAVGDAGPLIPTDAAGFTVASVQTETSQVVSVDAALVSPSLSLGDSTPVASVESNGLSASSPAAESAPLASLDLLVAAPSIQATESTAGASVDATGLAAQSAVVDATWLRSADFSTVPGASPPPAVEISDLGSDDTAGANARAAYQDPGVLTDSESAASQVTWSTADAAAIVSADVAGSTAGVNSQDVARFFSDDTWSSYQAWTLFESTPMVGSDVSLGFFAVILSDVSAAGSSDVSLADARVIARETTPIVTVVVIGIYAYASRIVPDQSALGSVERTILWLGYPLLGQGRSSDLTTYGPSGSGVGVKPSSDYAVSYPSGDLLGV